MLRTIGAAVTAAALTFAGSASAAVIQTWTFPSDEPYFDLFPYSFGSMTGRYTVTLRSTRAFAYSSASMSEYVDWHLHPVSGPSSGAGGKWYESNQLAYRSGAQAISIDFASKGTTEAQDCCWPSGDEWVPYDEHWYRDTQLHASFDFAQGSDPITVTLSLSAIPEPSTWALMIFGFGAVGSAVRSSRRRNAAAAA